jgi:hypothetical protein
MPLGISRGFQGNVGPPTSSRTAMDPGIWPYLAAANPGGDVHDDAAWVVVASSTWRYATRRELVADAASASRRAAAHAAIV